MFYNVFASTASCKENFAVLLLYEFIEPQSCRFMEQPEVTNNLGIKISWKMEDWKTEI
jgi:hypothetical protein